MTRKHIIFSTVTSLAIAFANSISCVGSETNDMTWIEQCKNLRALTEAERAELVFEVGKDWHQLEESLVEQFEKGDHDVKCYAAYLLGKFRLSKRVKFLADWILLRDEIRPQLAQREWAWGEYPVVSALVRIGKPAVPPMLENIKASADSKVRSFSLFVIRSVEGKEIAEFVLQREIISNKDATSNQRLQEAFVTCPQELDQFLVEF